MTQSKPKDPHMCTNVSKPTDVRRRNGGRMFITDFAGSVYSANLDGSDQKTLLFAQGNLTGIAYAEIQAQPLAQDSGPA
jgi:hypothetical protein